MFAQKARKNVENARLSLDAAKSKAKSGGGIGFPNLGGARQQDPHHEEHLTEEQRVEVETAEDEFVGCTEEAVGVMKNVLDTPEPLRNLADLVQAQLEFHKKAFEIYSELAPLIEGLQVEQEVWILSSFSPVLCTFSFFCVGSWSELLGLDDVMKAKRSEDYGDGMSD